VPARRITEIVHGTRAITADTALRLARYFGTSKRSWLNVQSRYDLEVEKDRLGKRLAREVLQRAIWRAVPRRRHKTILSWCGGMETTRAPDHGLNGFGRGTATDRWPDVIRCP